MWPKLLLITLLLSVAASACGMSSSDSRDRFAREAVGWAVSGDAARLYANLYPAQRNAIGYSVYSSCLNLQTRSFKRLRVAVRVEQTSVGASKTITVPATDQVVRAAVVIATVSWVRAGNRKRSDLPVAVQRAFFGRPVYVAMVGNRWRYIDPRVAIFAKPNCGLPALGSELLAKVPQWAAMEGFQKNATAVEGAKLFAVSGFLNCHTYNGAGGEELGAPDLTAEGAKHNGVAFQMAHLECPSCIASGSPMPSFAGLGEARLKQLAVFLEASKGRR
jgi:hypothetical protein